MAQIILDISANTFKNNFDLIRQVINEIRDIDTGKHEIIFKAQLFINEGNNISFNRDVFSYLYNYADVKGYQCTASVFDLNSIEFLLKFDIPFVKIACRSNLNWIFHEIPRKIPVYQSVRSDQYSPKREINNVNFKQLICVPKYPAKLYEYEQITDAFSDHTEGLELFKTFKPTIWEKHLKLSDSTGLDAGPFAITPQELKGIL